MLFATSFNCFRLLIVAVVGSLVCIRTCGADPIASTQQQAPATSASEEPEEAKHGLPSLVPVPAPYCNNTAVIDALPGSSSRRSKTSKSGSDRCHPFESVTCDGSAVVNASQTLTLTSDLVCPPGFGDGNINEAAITVEGEGAVLDCAGHKITKVSASNSEDPIGILLKNGGAAVNCHVSNFEEGVIMEADHVHEARLLLILQPTDPVMVLSSICILPVFWQYNHGVLPQQPQRVK